MEADKSGTITLADMVTRLIADNQLSVEEEIKIKRMIEEKQRERGGRCLAVVIDTSLYIKNALRNPESETWIPLNLPRK